MMHLIHNLPPHILGVEASGKVTDTDYKQVLVPEAEAKLETHDKISMLYVVRDVDAVGLKAMWQDLKFDTAHWNDVSRVAIVVDRELIGLATELDLPFFDGEIKIFNDGEMEQARNWIT